MYRLPELPSPPVEFEVPGELKELWLTALKRPEAEMRLKAASSIALAHQRGDRQVGRGIMNERTAHSPTDLLR